MSKENYQICNRCIMDTSDPEIKFDGQGNCSHCNSALNLARQIWFPDEHGGKILKTICDKIKHDGKDKEFDCIIGLSGGVDSSYLAYITVKMGLRPLVVHVDCGWNSELAVKNIENIVKTLNIELHTFVVNWEEMKDLQRAFFKASLPDQDIPQDHAIFAALYTFAEENKVKYVFSGHNFASESIMPNGWGYQAMDYRHLKDIHKRFGEKELKEYPHVTFFQRYIYFELIRKMEIINPLNYINYRKADAIETLIKEVGWQNYGSKHYESRFTKFFQSYYLPFKFGFDKRRGHLSSLIISGQISRDFALNKMSEPLFSDSEINNDLEFVGKKLDWSKQEFREIIDLPQASHKDFATSEYLFNAGLRFRRTLRLITRNSI